MSPAGFLFDLDMTLLDTSALQAARDQRNWDFVFANLRLVRPFSADTVTAAHLVPGVLHGLGHPVAIVTSSPRKYAKALLKKFKVHYDTLVAYEDTPNHKPHPDPLKAALKGLGVKASNAYYVGDAKDDFAASYHAGIRSVGAGWNRAVKSLWQTAPDIFLYDPGLLMRPHLLPRLGYIAEVCMAGLKPKLHQGSILRCGRTNLAALGRYYPKKHERHATDDLTEAILTLKKDDGPAPFFGRVLAHYVKSMKRQPLNATCVPPKPSQTRNRFVATLNHMKVEVKRIDLYPDGMKALREVENYKHTAPAERAALVRRAFSSEYRWGNESVLLLDDVFTSGATTDECARVLTKDRAAFVHTVCFAANQEPFELHRCPQCGRVLNIYKRRDNQVRFWGCPGKYKDGCPYTRDY
jgi:HAD superfamily hydrolase (TIGR01549 family)